MYNILTMEQFFCKISEIFLIKESDSISSSNMSRTIIIKYPEFITNLLILLIIPSRALLSAWTSNKRKMTRKLGEHSCKYEQKPKWT